MLMTDYDTPIQVQKSGIRLKYKKQVTVIQRHLLAIDLRDIYDISKPQISIRKEITVRHPLIEKHYSIIMTK